MDFRLVLSSLLNKSTVYGTEDCEQYLTVRTAVKAVRIGAGRAGNRFHRDNNDEALDSMDWLKGKSKGNHGFYHQI